MSAAPFPRLPAEWEPTRATLHAYAHGVSAIPRIHAPSHPKWWHASLKVRPTGLVTEAVPLPAGGTLQLRMDLNTHQAVVETSHGDAQIVDMTAGLTGTEFADRLIEIAASHGLAGDYVRDKFESDEARGYDPDHAATFWTALTNVHATIEAHRLTLDGEYGPLQLWPHGFDLAFEWFGTKVETFEEDGETTTYPSQLNLGFYPSGDAYFYSNPWPFDESLIGEELPHGAVWNTEGWQGSKLAYADLAGRDDAPTRLREYAARVFELAAPTLTA